MDQFAKIGDRIKAKRRGKGLSQEQLAAQAGCHVQSLSRWERGERAPVGESLIRLAKALDVTAEWLFSGDSADRVAEHIVPFSARGQDMPDNLQTLTPAQHLFLKLMGHRIEGLSDDQVAELERQIDHLIRDGKIKPKT